jgi:tetratricopeptide (TPR) repeat protein
MSRPSSHLAAVPLSLFACALGTELVAQDRAAYALLVQRAEAAIERFDFAAAEARYTEAIAAGEAAGVELHELIELERSLARIQGLREQPERSIATLQHAIARIDRATGSHKKDRLECICDLAIKQREIGAFAESLATVRRGLALVDSDIEGAELLRLRLLDSLVRAAVVTADYPAQLEGTNQTIEVLTRMGAADSGDIVLPLKQASQALQSMGRDREAIPVVERWIRIHEKIRGADNPGIAEALERLVSCQIASGELDDAQRTVGRWKAILDKAQTDHPNLVDNLVWGARIMTLRNRPGEAADLLEEAMARGRTALWNNQLRLGGIALSLARASREAGRLERARQTLEDARKYHRAYAEGSFEALQIAIESAQLALAEGSPGEAVTTMEAAVKTLETGGSKQHPALVEPLRILSRAYAALDRA